MMKNSIENIIKENKIMVIDGSMSKGAAVIL